MLELNRFKSDSPPEKLVEALEGDGYAIVENLLSAQQLRDLKAELAPHLEARAPGSENMMGTKTRRFGGLLWRSRTVQDLVTHPLVLSVADAVLLPYCVRYQINYTGVMYLEPGETTQPLHRDTGFYPFQNPAPPLLLATMWALSDFSAENGGTCLVPGSRHWDDSREPKPEEIVAAEMPAGSVLIYIGNTFHGGGANRSDQARFGLALHYSLGWLRQEENQYLSVPLEKARELPTRVQELLGYSLGASALGFVDHQDPLEFLQGSAGEQSGDIYGGVLEADQALERFGVSGTAVSGRHYYQVALPERADPGTED